VPRGNKKQFEYIGFKYKTMVPKNNKGKGPSNTYNKEFAADVDLIFAKKTDKNIDKNIDKNTGIIKLEEKKVAAVKVNSLTVPAIDASKIKPKRVKRISFRYGKIKTIQDGIVIATGLKFVKSGEVVYFVDSVTKKQINIRGLVLNLNTKTVHIILLGNERLLKVGDFIIHRNNLLKLATTLGLFGNVNPPFGIVIDAVKNGEGVDLSGKYMERLDVIEKKAVGIIGRTPVNFPLRTGIKAIDSLVTIGCGQRELIIGDRQTGKTSVAVETIIGFVRQNNLILSLVNKLSKIFKKSTTNCVKLNLVQLRDIFWFVYVAIGQKQATVNNIKYQLHESGAAWFTAVIAAFAADSAPVQFIAPYSGCALGEFLRDVVGGNCTMIYDDLSKHAVAYRQMSLLLRRPPGREAFPGDVFYVHSRLLERAGALLTKSVSVAVFGKTKRFNSKFLGKKKKKTNRKQKKHSKQK